MTNYYELNEHLAKVADALDDAKLREASKAFTAMLDFVASANRIPSPGGQHVGMYTHYTAYARAGLVERVAIMRDAAIKMAAGEGVEGG